MVQKIWVPESRKTLLCVDSYEEGFMTGRFYAECQEAEGFSGLPEFFRKMENTLDENQEPQAYTTHRRFSELLPPEDSGYVPAMIRRGTMATFEVQVLFRQHSSWQGMVVWTEKKMQQRFRSVLELVILLDSALRSGEESDIRL